MVNTAEDTEPILESVCETRAVRRAYDLWSRIYGEVAAPLEHGPRKLALEMAAIQPHETVLEVAVGPGQILLEIRKRVNPTNAVYGIDLSWKMLEKSRRRFRRAGYTNVSLLEADAGYLPFSDQSFDVLYSSYILDILSIRDVAATLTEFLRVLKPSGRVVLVNLSKAQPQHRTWVERLYRFLPASWVPYLLGGCRPVLLQNFMNKAGFRDVKRTFIGGMMSSEIITARKASA